MSTNDVLALGINPDVPHAARIYDYLIGGKDNFAADREAAEALIRIVPYLRQRARENRAFLMRTVRHLAEAGVRQFLDIGSGLPTAENVHQIVHRVAPDARIAYVDSDEIAVVHGNALLAGAPDGPVRMVHADVRDTAALLDHPDIAGLFDRGQPIAVIMIALLHFIPGGQAREIVDTMRAWLPEGSHLVISHATPGDLSPEAQREGTAVYERANMQITMRSVAEITSLFDGFQLSPEGVVPVSEWRPEGGFRERPPSGGHFVGGVARLAGGSEPR
ncbi:SAM-dependent methyltransferase [Microbispora sp. RL4-1S]|uniref:SAM-dependent methyltransferase n=1 Tax=Microbispora oryzae TaxID=2806554 RepID=A0A941ASB1_9ACTN|nr:SAM-dependent methyltransferase [Microbispora oryzae]MBP2707834.1 SAM-dependent methyltransferase [Microbispora oryzae]